jgi:hypothetical protein
MMFGKSLAKMTPTQNETTTVRITHTAFLRYKFNSHSGLRSIPQHRDSLEQRDPRRRRYLVRHGFEQCDRRGHAIRAHKIVAGRQLPNDPIEQLAGCQRHRKGFALEEFGRALDAAHGMVEDGWLQPHGGTRRLGIRWKQLVPNATTSSDLYKPITDSRSGEYM